MPQSSPLEGKEVIQCSSTTCPRRRARLVTVADDARLIEAAGLPTSGTDLVVVCSGGGIIQGAVTKTDVVRQISTCRGAACHVTVDSVMTRDVVLCRGSDRLQDVSERVKARHLKNIPVVDRDNRPLGLLTARAIFGGHNADDVQGRNCLDQLTRAQLRRTATCNVTCPSSRQAKPV